MYEKKKKKKKKYVQCNEIKNNYLLSLLSDLKSFLGIPCRRIFLELPPFIKCQASATNPVT